MSWVGRGPTQAAEDATEAGSGLPALPGPGWTLPVDLDGDGQSSFGDQYAFNSWLEAGGDPGVALNAGSVRDGVVDLSEFFSSRASALSADAAVSAPLPEIAASAAESLAPSAIVGGGLALLIQSADRPNFTHRVPSQLGDSDLTHDVHHPRMTPDGRFTVFSTASNLLDLNPPPPAGVEQVYRGERGATGGSLLKLISVDASGSPADEDCIRPAISDDGLLVVFETEASLAAGDVNVHSDVYVRDMTDQDPLEHRMVAVTFGMDGPSYGPAISGNGSTIVFTTEATDFESDIVPQVDWNGTVADTRSFLPGHSW